MFVKIEVQSAEDDSIVLKIHSSETDQLREVYQMVLKALYYYNPEMLIEAIEELAL